MSNDIKNIYKRIKKSSEGLTTLNFLNPINTKAEIFIKYSSQVRFTPVAWWLLREGCNS